MKILSIDFDAIMFPCIRLYNNYCAGKESDTRIWEMLEAEFGIKNFLSYDANLYLNIMKLVIQNVKNGAVFIPIKEHDELITYLKNNNLTQIDMEITNLDFHHDIMYHRESISSILDFDKWNCADWLGYLLLKNKNNKGTWVKCPGSDIYHADHTGQTFEEQLNIISIKDIQELLENNYDLVFLCLSPQWVPYQYHHLYDAIVIAAESNTSLKTDLKSPDNFQEQEQEIIVLQDDKQIKGDEITND